ncbi:hypothetical protein CEXT_448121 [Caerostris extrusa]|uniref:Uncharacterized protein n=1 Tax=Caerostris extrusa TaxID=172846 RepID=A0AAV4XUY1_CAEEX|nr:hypothetical protein CEXT_448121 [Caerostris extrusa]
MPSTNKQFTSQRDVCSHLHPICSSIQYFYHQNLHYYPLVSFFPKNTRFPEIQQPSPFYSRGRVLFLMLTERSTSDVSDHCHNRTKISLVTCRGLKIRPSRRSSRWDLTVPKTGAGKQRVF